MDTDISDVWEQLVQDGEKIIYVSMDGLGGIPHPDSGKTALQAAYTPQLDKLAASASCGLLETVGPGITPGSGPGHQALFGYDPLRYRLGRGVLSALGIDFQLQPGDVAARINFATLDSDDVIIDRRAGRIETSINRARCERIRDQVKLDFDGEYFLETVSQHRAVLVLRGEGLSDDLDATDPQQTGVTPLEPQPRSDEAELTARLVASFANQVRGLLKDEDSANAMLLRGFQRFEPLRSLQQRFRLRGLCIARYPMYRGLSRLLGMDVTEPSANVEASFTKLADCFGDHHDFYFVHAKDTDKYGEDADFQAKVEAVEAVDRQLIKLETLDYGALVVTSDHSTPAALGAHSWHPVPVMIHAPGRARSDNVKYFDELSCQYGSLGLRPGVHLMGLALAHAGRLKKFGA